jgi:nitroreductase
METLACIQARRSIRRFTEHTVEKEKIEELVKAASLSPSWKNSQTVRFIAISDPTIRKEIIEKGLCGFEKNQLTTQSAPTLIVLTTLNGRSGYEKDGSYSTTKGTHWQSFDAGIAAQTFCLAACDAGLGTVIMGVYKEDEIAAILSLPKEQSISALIALGYPAEHPSAPARKEVSDLLSFR